jgi:hypothetical protein
VTTTDAASVLRNRNFLLFLAARFCSAMASMMFSVAVGWQVHALTGSAFALGMVGVAQFLPAFFLTLRSPAAFYLSQGAGRIIIV